MKSKKGTAWTKEEEKFLIENNDIPLAEVSNILGRGLGLSNGKDKN
ncbi:MAG: hypothetical protein ACW981_15855 [Candidatus Hodarchaeales archaeon]|jgi:hypothetical protein